MREAGSRVRTSGCVDAQARKSRSRNTVRERHRPQKPPNAKRQQTGKRGKPGLSKDFPNLKLPSERSPFTPAADRLSTRIQSAVSFVAAPPRSPHHRLNHRLAYSTIEPVSRLGSVSLGFELGVLSLVIVLTIAHWLCNVDVSVRTG
jgi:hypothetical protein